MNLLSLVLNMVYETRDRLGPVGMQCRFMQPAQREEGSTHAALCGWQELPAWWALLMCLHSTATILLSTHRKLPGHLCTGLCNAG